MADPEDIELGYRVRDRIGDIEGIVTSIATHISGCDRIGVRPSDQKQDTDPVYFFPSELSVVEDDTEFTSDAEESITSTHVDMGSQVRDEVADVQGVVTTITYSLYNCPRVAITPITSDKTESKDRFWSDAPRVQVIGPGVNKDLDELSGGEAEVETGSAGSDLEMKEDEG